jgi:hypothetical protein
MGVALAQLALNGAAWAGFLTALRGRRPESLPDLLGRLADLLGAAGVRWPWLVLAVAGSLTVAGLALLVLAVVRVQPRILERSSVDGPGDTWDDRWEEGRGELAPQRGTPAS